MGTASTHGARVRTIVLGLLLLAGVAAVCLVLLAAGPGSSPSARGSTTVSWPAPALQDPQVIQLTSTNTHLKLDQHRDYVLLLPRHAPLQAPGGLSIWGGHNVVMTGGTVEVPDRSGAAALTDQTGTIHIEGVRFTGPQLMEGIDLSESAGATVELENVYVATVHGSYRTNHADLIQSWAGPRRLLVDGFWGSTQYQGFFLLPNQHYDGPAPKLFDLRNVYINDSQGAYALWLQSTPRVPLHVSNMSVTPNPARTWRGWWLWPKPSTGDSTWTGVRATARQPGAGAGQVARAGIYYQQS